MCEANGLMFGAGWSILLLQDQVSRGAVAESIHESDNENIEVDFLVTQPVLMFKHIGRWPTSRTSTSSTRAKLSLS